MEKVTLKEFADLINSATKAGEDTSFRITEYDDNIFSVEVNRKDIIYLVVPEESYDILFETLKKEFEERHRVFWTHDFCGRHGAIIAIDEKVIVDLDYGLSEGKNWLYLHEGE